MTCVNLAGRYAASFGGISCGNFSLQASAQRIVADGCAQKFEYDDSASKGVSGSFVVDAAGNFGPVMLTLATQSAQCVGSTPSPGMVRLSCNQNACLMNFTRTGPN